MVSTMFFHSLGKRETLDSFITMAQKSSVVEGPNQQNDQISKPHVLMPIIGSKLVARLINMHSVSKSD